MNNELATMDVQSQLAPSRIGQATAVEQTRAIAEVQAAIFVAQSAPRNEATAVARMRSACAQESVASRAFFRFPRGGKNVTGASVHLARELARCWGNIQYGVNELRRDDDAGQSEMQAWAWDVEANSRVSSTFIVPHRRDKKGGGDKLTDLRDIYENNANNGARRVREAVFSVLPSWFVQEAEERCRQAIAGGSGDKPIAQRVADAVAAFERLGVTADQLEDKLGRESDKWTDAHLSELLVIHGSIGRGEATVEEEFPSKKVTAAELTAGPEVAEAPDA